MREIRRCAYCGNCFVATHYNVKYCSLTCRDARNLRVQSESRKRPRGEAGREKPAKSLVDIAVEARKAGMTYGQYVAKMKL